MLLAIERAIFVGAKNLSLFDLDTALMLKSERFFTPTKVK